MKLKRILNLILITSLFLTSCTLGTNDKDRESEIENEIEKEDESETETYQTITVKDSDLTVCAGISKDNPNINIESVEDLVLKNSETESSHALIRVPLPAGVSYNDLSSATLRLKKKSGDEPSLKATAVTKPWDRLEVTWDEMKDSLDTASLNFSKEDNDWYSIDITEIAKNWLNGTIGQYGLMIEELQSNKETSFYSSYEGPETCPELTFTYSQSSENETKFGYEPQEEGNCLSFALRDNDPIDIENLELDFKDIQEIYSTQGLDALAKYVEDKALNYINEHSDDLKLVQIRKLSSFNEEIDPMKEYRIATRVGAQENLDGSIQFDYHWQVQLPNGSWAEKFGYVPSRIVPGSNRDLDPGLFPWDQNEIWGFKKWTAFYNSKASYYAVEKSTDDFTAHRTSNNN